jgi:hypothetical protein
MEPFPQLAVACAAVAVFSGALSGVVSLVEKIGSDDFDRGLVKIGRFFLFVTKLGVVVGLAASAGAGIGWLREHRAAERHAAAAAAPPTRKSTAISAPAPIQLLTVADAEEVIGRYLRTADHKDGRGGGGVEDAQQLGAEVLFSGWLR